MASQKAAETSDCDSILNLDELLRDENSSAQQAPPPETLDGWAGPNIFRGMVVASSQHSAGRSAVVKLALENSQDGRAACLSEQNAC